jgi:hypothetical protein
VEEKAMTLDETLLAKLADWRPDNGRDTLEAADPATGWTVRLTADAVDGVGCRVWELALRPGTAPAADLSSRAQAVAARVRGLLEPLHVVEVDAPRQVALIRSDMPTQRNDALYYTELLLQADGASLVRRYQAPRPGEPRRQQIPFALTHEALGKLVSDLIA